MPPFTTLDIILLVLILFFIIKAAIRGLVDEFFGIATFIFGAYLAIRLAPKLKPYLASNMNPTLANILAFLILFIVFFLITKILQIIIKSIFSGQILSSLDHALGFIYGAAEGIVLVIIVLSVMSAFQPWIDTASLRENSFFGKILGNLINAVSTKASEINA